MKKILSFMLCVMLFVVMLLPLTAHAAAKDLIIDDMDRMTKDEINELSAYARQMSNDYSMDVAFFLVSNTYSPEQSLSDHIRERYLGAQALGPDGFVLAYDIDGKLWSMVSFGKAELLITDDMESRFWDAFVDTGDTYYSGVLGYLAEAEAFLAEQAAVDGQDTPAMDRQPASAEKKPPLIVDPSFFAAGSGNYVLDETGTLTNEQITRLNEKAASFTEKRQCGLYIWIVDLVPEEYAKSIDNMEAYADAFYAKYNLGYGDERNGMLLVLEIGDVPGERDYLLNTHGSSTEILSNSRREYVLDEIVPLFRDAFRTGDFYSVADTLIDKIDSQFTIAITLSLILKLAIIVLIPLFVAWRVCKAWTRQMKTAVIARAADSYIPDGGFTLIHQADQFLYQTTSRVKIERSSSSSGGSSSSSSGRSSGGKV